MLLRHDNADTRLTPAGRAMGLVTDEAWAAFEERQAALADGLRRASATKLGAGTIRGDRFDGAATIADALRRPDLGYADVAGRFVPPLAEAIGERVAVEVRVEGYVKREAAAVERAARHERLEIPEAFDYEAIRALSLEAREKLGSRRPRTLGAAGRIPGVTPADIAIVGMLIERGAVPA